MNARQESNIRRFLLPTLRSGVFRQAKGSLRERHDQKDSFCCLGVASDIVEGDAWRPEPWIIDTGTLPSDYNGDIYFMDPFTKETLVGTMTTSVMVFYGMETSGNFEWDKRGNPIRSDFNPNVRVPDDAPMALQRNKRFTLTSLNDAGVPFSEIADVIEYILDTPGWSFVQPKLPDDTIDEDEVMDTFEAHAIERMNAMGIAIPELV